MLTVFFCALTLICVCFTGSNKRKKRDKVISVSTIAENQPNDQESALDKGYKLALLMDQENDAVLQKVLATVANTAAFSSNQVVFLKSIMCAYKTSLLSRITSMVCY